MDDGDEEAGSRRREQEPQDERGCMHLAEEPGVGGGEKEAQEDAGLSAVP